LFTTGTNCSVDSGAIHETWRRESYFSPFLRIKIDVGDCATAVVPTDDFASLYSIRTEHIYMISYSTDLGYSQVVKNENDESQVDMLLKDIGMGIVARCDGLPLAVKAMGGLLRQKKIRQSDWENVLNDSIWSVSQMPEDLNHAIYLSYKDLPSSLKPCFLHFSLLPKSTIFLVHQIVDMWISEGFVHGGTRDLAELGREYFDELIFRNLIEPDFRHVDHIVCSMHDGCSLICAICGPR
jgi:hypothetical protein